MNYTTACPDWEQRLINRQSIIPPPIFPETGEKALAIFKQLRIVDLPGQPTFGECSEQWVFDFVLSIFGAYDEESGNQLIREFFLLISKKNTKSTIAAGIMLTAVIICWRYDEEHLILAPTKEVADNSFKPAAGMIRADEELTALFQVQDHIRTITNRLNRATLKVVAADTDTVSGKKSGKILIDEHWLFGRRANADAMFLEATGGQVSRDEGWVIYLTTQSDEPPEGVFLEKLEYYRDVRDGKEIDPRSLGILYEFPEKMIKSKAYLKPENFYITNPNLGRSVSHAWLEDQLKKNRRKEDGSFNKFLAKHLNVEIGMNLRSNRWSGADFWLRQSHKEIDLEYLIDNSDVIEIGIDGGGLDDMLGLAVLGREIDTGDWLLWNKAWIFTQAIKERKQNEAKYYDFQKDGDLEIVKLEYETDDEGNPLVSDEDGRIAFEKIMDGIIEIVLACENSGLLDMLGVDPHGMGMIIDFLEKVFDRDRIVGIQQGWKLSSSIKTVGLKVATQTLRHAGQPMMTWCVGNAKQEQNGNAVSITKQMAGTCKIDPLVATFCAGFLMSLNPDARGRSVYDKRGIIEI